MQFLEIYGAIADALAPSLLPRYYVAVETRTYLDSSDEELLVGISDAVVLSILGPSVLAKPEISGAGMATTVGRTAVRPYRDRQKFSTIPN